eukprot:10214238-Prorocentrum_lima.AAC.1
MVLWFGPAAVFEARQSARKKSSGVGLMEPHGNGENVVQNGVRLQRYRWFPGGSWRPMISQCTSLFRQARPFI